MIQTILLGACTAALDVMTGVGLLAFRSTVSDVLNPRGDGSTLADVELGEALGRLALLGIEPCADEDEAPIFDPELSDGRRVCALYLRDAIHSDASSLLSLVHSHAELRSALVSEAA